ncbi:MULTISPECIES: porin [unclassified Endozoicomonas]|uniref:porin n=1 Tax=unclassified Endozoicomonas TaxID=2644528 RepID=UPI00214818EE|nr:MULTISPECIES: porin [unclassified Endozoicomonas]
MHKKILAAAVATAVAGPAMAVNVYDDGTSSLSIGGRVGVVAKNHDGDNTLNNDSARINFKFAHKFDSGWTGQGVAEWGFRAKDEYDADGNKEETFFNRLGYVGLSHEEMGAFAAGKNWSVTYDVSGWTDMYAIGGGSALGIYDGRNGGDFDGSARADDVIQYRNSFGGLNIGLQYQMQDQTVTNAQRDSGFGISASYDLAMGLSLGAAYSETKYEETGTFADQEKSKSATAGLKFENERLYLAAMYGELTNKTNLSGDLDAKSKGIELYGRLAMNNVLQGFSLEAGYNELKDNSSASTDQFEATLKETMIGAIYETGPMQFAVEYAIDDSKNTDGKKEGDNTLSVQARYYF